MKNDAANRFIRAARGRRFEQQAPKPSAASKFVRDEVERGFKAKDLRAKPSVADLKAELAKSKAEATRLKAELDN